VLQIGADVYCDTLRIAVELDRRFPTAPVCDATTHGLSGILGTWAERVLMWPTARYVTGMNRHTLSQDFFADRAAMRGHATPTMEEVERTLPHQRRQLAIMLGWIESVLADGRAFLITDRPVLGDLALYQRLWWLGALDGRAASAIEPYTHTKAWMGRIAALGHGNRREMSPEEALDVARESEPRGLPAASPDAEFAVGTTVEVVTEDFGADAVRGAVVHCTADEISIRRVDPQLGTLDVHFPRLGYEIRAIGASGPSQ
jgi:glutathione S-transferase